MAEGGVDNTNCCVSGCRTCRKRDKNISFHLFPRPNSGYVYIKNAFGGMDKVDRKKAWEQALLMDKPATPFMRVCSKHFTAQDYLYASSLSSKKPRLQKTTIPSRNLPKRSSRSKAKASSANLKIGQLCHKRETNFEDGNKKLRLKELSAVEGEAVDVLLNFVSVTSSDSKEEIHEDKNVQSTEDMIISKEEPCSEYKTETIFIPSTTNYEDEDEDEDAADEQKANIVVKEEEMEDQEEEMFDIIAMFQNHHQMFQSSKSGLVNLKHTLRSIKTKEQWEEFLCSKSSKLEENKASKVLRDPLCTNDKTLGRIVKENNKTFMLVPVKNVVFIKK